MADPLRPFTIAMVVSWLVIGLLTGVFLLIGAPVVPTIFAIPAVSTVMWIIAALRQSVIRRRRARWAYEHQLEQLRRERIRALRHLAAEQREQNRSKADAAAAVPATKPFSDPSTPKHRKLR